MITFEDFQKLEIKIGKVKSAEKIPGSDKLLKLIFDLGPGEEERQIIAGIALFVDSSDELVGKEMPILTNLEPRMLMGHESQGMILACDNGEGIAFLNPDREVPPGSRVR